MFLAAGIHEGALVRQGTLMSLLEFAVSFCTYPGGRLAIIELRFFNAIFFLKVAYGKNWLFNPRPVRAFLITRTVRGGLIPPLPFQN